MEFGPSAPFQTADEVYTLMRAGELDPAIYGVARGLPFCGEPFVVGEVFYEVAHRYGDEVLLWDGWGAVPPPEQPVDHDVLALIDEVARLLLLADSGDPEAESALYQRYCDDPRIHPGASVQRFSPFGDPPVEVTLRG